MQRNYMTKEGFEKLKSEIQKIQIRLKKEVAEEIATARDKGDLKENAEYDAAKKKQQALSMKLQDLGQRLAAAEVIDPLQTPPDIVSMGKKVSIVDLDTDAAFTYTILGDGDTDVDNNIISYKSPLAKGLIGHKVNEEVEVQLPRRLARYKITAIVFIGG